MKTGEGKTLVATLPVYLNALAGKGVHVVTVNDYLARRDAEWMGQIYRFLGLKVGCIVHGLLDDAERRAAYAADVTYGTNNEFGFDYLRDNMKFKLEEHGPARLQLRHRRRGRLDPDRRGAHAADHLRPDRGLLRALRRRRQADPQARLRRDYEKDEKAKRHAHRRGQRAHRGAAARDGSADLGDSLYDIQNINLLHHVNQALSAHKLFKRDTDYIVKDDKVIIIDEFTGRMMEGRRYSEGLHQALEAKEGSDPATRTRPSPRSPSRTTSGSIRSSPA